MVVTSNAYQRDHPVADTNPGLAIGPESAGREGAFFVLNLNQGAVGTAAGRQEWRCTPLGQLQALADRLVAGTREYVFNTTVGPES